MRIPETISRNTIIVYQPHEKLRKQTYLNSDDFSWDKNIPKPLHELCVESIANNWINKPLLSELILNKNIRLLLDILPTDLPHNLTVSTINDDVYWRRCFFARWPNKLPLENPETDTSIDYENPTDNSTISRRSSLASIKTSINSVIERKQDVASKCSDEISIKSDVLKSKGSTEIDWPLRIVKKTWKCCYLELHLQDVLENMKPEDYEPEKMKELSDLCGFYVQTLEMKQLTARAASSEVADRIPLCSILSGLPLLTELSLCFKQTYVGEQFSWQALQTTLKDVKMLADGLKRCNLQLLRIYNSDVDCQKVTIILESLLKNKCLKTLNFSHCKIGNAGALAISKFLYELPTLKSLILTNNFVGFEGMEYLSFILSHSNIELNHLDVRLNEIGEQGGNYLASALVKGACQLESLQLSGCKLNYNNLPLIEMLKFNSKLKWLDISNNRLNKEVGEHILQVLNVNRTLISIDMRICNISPEITLKIKEKLISNMNLTNKMANENYEKNYDYYNFDNKSLNEKLESVFVEVNGEKLIEEIEEQEIIVFEEDKSEEKDEYVA